MQLPYTVDYLVLGIQKTFIFLAISFHPVPPKLRTYMR